MKSRTAAFFLNFFFPGMGFAYLGKPTLVIAGTIFFIVTGIESFRASLKDFSLESLGLGLVGALCLAVIAGEMTEVMNRSKPETRKCPHCAEVIKAEAQVCKHCGREVQAV